MLVMGLGTMFILLNGVFDINTVHLGSPELIENALSYEFTNQTFSYDIRQNLKMYPSFFFCGPFECGYWLPKYARSYLSHNLNRTFCGTQLWQGYKCRNPFIGYVYFAIVYLNAFKNVLFCQNWGVQKRDESALGQSVPEHVLGWRELGVSEGLRCGLAVWRGCKGRASNRGRRRLVELEGRRAGRFIARDVSQGIRGSASVNSARRRAPAGELGQKGRTTKISNSSKISKFIHICSFTFL